MQPFGTCKMIPYDNDVYCPEKVEEPQLCDLFSFSAGNRVFAVPVEEVEATAENKHAASLPNSPPGVLGIVCVRGRMLTTLDPVFLTTGVRLEWPLEVPGVIALRGDEQLGLAAESLGETITIAAADIRPPDSDENPAKGVLTGLARYGGEEIKVLRVEALFAAAVQRKERRRRRF
jgi:purine-binding chemotaxis protein CheW